MNIDLLNKLSEIPIIVLILLTPLSVILPFYIINFGIWIINKFNEKKEIKRK